MIKSKNKLVLLILAALLIIPGCSANTYNARVVPFVTPPPPAADETSIFVFREDSMVGAARKFAIIDNDTVMGVLEPGSFCHFTVKSGEHEIVAYVAGPLIHYRIINRPGEIVFLHCKVGYSTGLFMEEIDRNTAEKMMERFKFMDIEIEGEKTEINYKDHYDKLYKS